MSRSPESQYQENDPQAAAKEMVVDRCHLLDAAAHNLVWASRNATSNTNRAPSPANSDITDPASFARRVAARESVSTGDHYVEETAA